MELNVTSQQTYLIILPIHYPATTPPEDVKIGTLFPRLYVYYTTALPVDINRWSFFFSTEEMLAIGVSRGIVNATRLPSTAWVGARTTRR